MLELYRFSRLGLKLELGLGLGLGLGIRIRVRVWLRVRTRIMIRVRVRVKIRVREPLNALTFHLGDVRSHDARIGRRPCTQEKLPADLLDCEPVGCVFELRGRYG